MLLFTASCRDIRVKEKKDWGKYFEAQGVKDGCFMLKDQTHEVVYYYNRKRDTTRFLPASTFKIFNSLVALETAKAPDETLVIKWDGIPRMQEWDKDMDMREAFKVSNVPYYQQIARTIGKEKMKYYIDSAKYGNMDLDSKIDTFWLDNTLKISADEQMGMMKKLYFDELKPFSARSQRIVRNLMLREETPEYKLYYKTGWGQDGDKNILWIVGWADKIVKVKEDEKAMNKAGVRIVPYFFAENFEVPASDTGKDLPAMRLAILKDILKDYGVIK